MRPARMIGGRKETDQEILLSDFFATDDALLGDRYKVIERIGHGAFADVRDPFRTRTSQP